MKTPIILLILRIVIAILLAQTLFFKFTGAAESIELFSQLSKAVKGDASLEPMMRIGSGVVELITVILLLMKKPVAISVGAFMATATMMGAMMAHLTVIGINFGGDATLFILAVVAFLSSLAVLFRYRGSLPVLGKFT
ncbi:MAG: DoxX family protein [Akkermansiaceae bacterium]|jgi:putative oxidoreductase|tara:strand:+ start:1128 stop:1541 length:414 start_codon:yes stop_codon:yes gene_type:complete